MSKSEAHAVIHAREAWERLKNDMAWEDWLLTGTALEIGRRECLHETHSNDINDKRYRNAFGAWLQENGFADMDKAARARLFQCIDHRAEIETWRATLSLTERLKLNHPNSVFRKWQAATVAGKATTQPAGGGLREANLRLQEELDTANAKIRRLEKDSGPMITATDSSEDIARVLLEWLPQSKQHPVASAMMRALKSTAPAPAKRGRKAASTPEVAE